MGGGLGRGGGGGWDGWGGWDGGCDCCGGYSLRNDFSRGDLLCGSHPAQFGSFEMRLVPGVGYGVNCTSMRPCLPELGEKLSARLRAAKKMECNRHHTR